jgi:hypothetical protein
MQEAHVLIKGEGLAALTAAYLLSQNGTTVSVQQEAVHARPVLMIPENTSWLLNDIWNIDDQLKQYTHPVSFKRIIQENGNADVFPVTAFSVEQNWLQQALKNKLKDEYPAVNWLDASGDENTARYNWVINAIPQETSFENFGTRCITACMFDYEADTAQNNYCQMLQIEGAWFFLFPVSTATGCLQVMHVPGAVYNFEEAAFIIKQPSGLIIKAAENKNAIVFPAFPRLSKKFYGENEIFIGPSLVRYDPIAGDGTGHAIRSAAWAARIIMRSFQNEDVKELKQTFQSSITTHFQQHLASCREHYKGCDF